MCPPFENQAEEKDKASEDSSLPESLKNLYKILLANPREVPQQLLSKVLNEHNSFQVLLVLIKANHQNKETFKLGLEIILTRLKTLLNSLPLIEKDLPLKLFEPVIFWVIEGKLGKEYFQKRLRAFFSPRPNGQPPFDSNKIIQFIPKD